MIVVGSAAHSQLTYLENKGLLPILQMTTDKSKLFDFKKPVIITTPYKPFLPADFYSKQLGFVCKQEIKMDKVIKVPFRFRLGSVEQCDWLEGKRR
ncbi:MAG: hypothetical protein V4685_06980 [Bacteroidota bacterium]